MGEAADAAEVVVERYYAGGYDGPREAAEVLVTHLQTLILNVRWLEEEVGKHADLAAEARKEAAHWQRQAKVSSEENTKRAHELSLAREEARLAREKGASDEAGRK